MRPTLFSRKTCDGCTGREHALDAKGWDRLRRAFADTLQMDYSSLFGDPALTIEADQQVAGWRSFAGAFDVTQHITGPLVVTPDGSGARARRTFAPITASTARQEAMSGWSPDTTSCG
jgi:SnoaL-like domain